MDYADMPHDILLIIGSACIALLFIQSGIPFTIRKWLKLRRLKPFDCELCLSFWLGMASAIYFDKNCVEVIYISAMASILAVFINKKLNS
jgi:hypothetical protein